MTQKLSAIWAILTAGKDQHWFLMRNDSQTDITSTWVNGALYGLAEGFCNAFSQSRNKDLYKLIEYGLDIPQHTGNVVDLEEYRR